MCYRRGLSMDLVGVCCAKGNWNLHVIFFYYVLLRRQYGGKSLCWLVLTVNGKGHHWIMHGSYGGGGELIKSIRYYPY